MGLWQLRQMADQHRVEMERVARRRLRDGRSARRTLGALTAEGGRRTSTVR